MVKRRVRSQQEILEDGLARAEMLARDLESLSTRTSSAELAQDINEGRQKAAELVRQLRAVVVADASQHRGGA